MGAPAGFGMRTYPGIACGRLADRAVEEGGI
jgi:hypothetical protein